MNRILEELWYTYQIGILAEQKPEEREALDDFVLLQEKLRESLTEEQKAIYDNYEICAIKSNCISEKEAFIKGVRFATQYLFETLGNPNPKQK